MRQIRAGRLPIVGGGTAMFSFVHALDAADAIMAAITHDGGGTFNVVDDEPAPMHAWATELARLLDAPRPRRVPAPVVRLLAGSWAEFFLTRLRGADNTLARTELGWRPRHPSWRGGLAAELSASSPAAAGVASRRSGPSA
ncbi:NAD(P)-dependent oxidoreductase [Frankia sp. QA3]|uniref:NAD(P)-dependent oxidoreductase n=1 Tax=Frankia sp. QA3 TaxID=710111 RepID=UPI0002F59BEC|nr:NAD(P)-dependent oxidoreductase [Frankia sp. QA3]